MKVNEYIPKGGWMKYRRRQEMKERIRVAAIAVALLVAYCVVGYIDGGIQ